MRRRLVNVFLYALSVLLFVGYVIALITGSGDRRSSQAQPVAIESGLIRLGHGVTDADGHRPDAVDLP